MVKRHTVKKRKINGYKHLRGGVVEFRDSHVDVNTDIDVARARAAEAKAASEKSASDAALAGHAETQIADLHEKAAMAKSKAEREILEREALSLEDRVRELQEAERAKVEETDEGVSSERDIEQAREKAEIERELTRELEERQVEEQHVKVEVLLAEKVSVKEALNESGVKELKEASKDVQQAQQVRMQDIALKEAKARATEQADALEVERTQLIKEALQAEVQRASDVVQEITYERVMETSRQGEKMLGEAQANIRANAVDAAIHFSDVKKSAESAVAEAKGHAETVNGTLHDLAAREYAQTGDKSAVDEQLKEAIKGRDEVDQKIEDAKKQIESANKDLTSAVDTVAGLHESVDALSGTVGEMTSARDAALEDAKTFRDAEPGKIKDRVQEIRDGQSGLTEQANAASTKIESTRGEQRLNESRTSGLKERLEGTKAEAAKAEAGSVDAFGKQVEGTREATTGADGKYGEMVDSLGSLKEGIRNTTRDPALDSKVDGAKGDIPKRVEKAPEVSGKLAVEGAKLEGIKAEIETVPLKADTGKLETAKNTFEDLSRPGGPADTAARQADVKNDMTEHGKNHENTTGAKDAMDVAEGGMPKEPARGDLTTAEGAAKTASEAAGKLREGVTESIGGAREAETANADVQTTIQEGTATEMKEGFKDAMEQAKSGREEAGKQESAEKPSTETLTDKQGGEKSARDALEEATKEANALEEADPMKDLPENLPESVRAELEAREAEARAEATRRELEGERAELGRLEERVGGEEVVREKGETEMKEAERVAEEARKAEEAAREEAARLEEANRKSAEEDAAGIQLR